LSPEELASNLARNIAHTIRAHSNFPLSPKDAVRFHDDLTPYAVHPIWCAMTFLTETALPADFRIAGYQALLWHDVLEDTTLLLPDGVSREVQALVQEMTFESFAEEQEEIWRRSENAQLLKLYDKVSNLLDGAWMSDSKWNSYVAYTNRLASSASERFGELNIVRIARAISIPRPPNPAA